MVNNARDIDNVVIMLKGLYPDIDNCIDEIPEYINDIDNVFAYAIIRCINHLIKIGIHREYVEIENIESSNIIGKIDIRRTITERKIASGKVICSYEEFEQDLDVNRIIRGIADYLSCCECLAKETRIEALKIKRAFKNIKPKDFRKLPEKELIVLYNNDTIRYKGVIEVIKIFLRDRRMNGSGIIDDNKRMYMMFKDYIHIWMLNRCTGCKVNLERKWFRDTSKEPQFEVEIFKKQRLTVIRCTTKILLICTRLRDEIVIEEEKIVKKHLQEAIKYAKMIESELGLTASACVVYVNTDKEEITDNQLKVEYLENRKIGTIIIDIHDNWKFIEDKLESIYNYFIPHGRRKRV